VRNEGTWILTESLFLISIVKLKGYATALVTIKVLDARRRGATTEAYGVIRRKEERSKATMQMMAYCDQDRGFGACQTMVIMIKGHAMCP
jgi:hypothetical protein